MSVLVTGGTGAVGSWVVKQLVADGVRPVIYDIAPNDLLVKDVSEKIDIVRGDILDFTHLLAVVKEKKIKQIIHLAAAMSPALRAKFPSMEIKINMIGTCNVLEAAKLMDIKRVICASSKAVYGVIKGEYGPPTYKPLTEDLANPGGISPLYGAQKFLIEQIGLTYKEKFGIEFIGVRFAHTFGAGKVLTYSGKITGLVDELIFSAIKNRPFNIERGGDSKNDYIYYKDLAFCLSRLCFKEPLRNNIFNVGTGKGFSFFDIERILKKHLPSAEIKIGPGEIWELRPCIQNIKRLQDEIGFQPKYLMDEAIPDYIATVRALGL